MGSSLYDLKVNWFKSKGFSGSLNDAMKGYFDSLTGSSSSNWKEAMENCLTSYSGTRYDKYMAFLNNKTSSNGLIYDLETKFYNDTTYDFITTDNSAVAATQVSMATVMSNLGASGYWPFNDASGSTVAATTGANGSYVGTPTYRVAGADFNVANGGNAAQLEAGVYARLPGAGKFSAIPGSGYWLNFKYTVGAQSNEIIGGVKNANGSNAFSFASGYNWVSGGFFSGYAGISVEFIDPANKIVANAYAFDDASNINGKFHDVWIYIQGTTSITLNVYFDGVLLTPTSTTRTSGYDFTSMLDLTDDLVVGGHATNGSYAANHNLAFPIQHVAYGTGNKTAAQIVTSSQTMRYVMRGMRQLAYWKASPTNCFKDAARTLPCSALAVGAKGDFVRGVTDLSGNAFHLKPNVYSETNQVKTFTAAITGVITAVHDFIAGDRVNFTTSNTLPAGLTVGTNYYVINPDAVAGTFKVSTTVGGSAVTITTTGTGTHTLHSDRGCPQLCRDESGVYYLLFDNHYSTNHFSSDVKYKYVAMDIDTGTGETGTMFATSFYAIVGAEQSVDLYQGGNPIIFTHKSSQANSNVTYGTTTGKPQMAISTQFPSPASTFPVIRSFPTTSFLAYYPSGDGLMATTTLGRFSLDGQTANGDGTYTFNAGFSYTSENIGGSTIGCFDGSTNGAFTGRFYEGGVLPTAWNDVETAAGYTSYKTSYGIPNTLSGVVLFIGDSITSDFMSHSLIGWNHQVKANGLMTNWRKFAAYVNAVPGYKTSDATTMGADNASYKIGLTSQKITAFFYLGTNDINNSIATATTESNLQTLRTNMLTNYSNTQFVALKMPPGLGAVTTLNAWFDSNLGVLWDKVVTTPDVALDPSDSLHPTDAGHTTIAGVVNTAITGLAM